MPRGKAAEVGTIRIAQNDYRYIKTEDGWRLLHHVIAEKKIGRPLRPDERVYFIDGNRADFDPSNLSVERAKKHKLNQLWLRMEKLEKDLNWVKAQLREALGGLPIEDGDVQENSESSSDDSL